MPTQQSHRRFLLWLSLTTALVAVGFAVMMTALLRQARSVEEATRLQGDSITALTFQFEREFLRFRSDLALALQGRSPPDWDNVALRYDIFLSRIDLLRNNPSTVKLRAREEYLAVMPKLDRLVAQATPLMEAPIQHPKELQATLDNMQDMGADVQALSIASSRVVAQLIDEQVDIVRTQSQYIRWLVGAQVVILLLAASSLVLRLRRQTREQQALEALNSQLNLAKEAAESANRGKSQFLANMSHELRTPFNGMLGMMSMLEDTPLTTQQRDFILTAKDSAHHLLSLLNDILDMSALESGKMKIQPEPVQLPRLLDDVHQLMQTQAKRKGLAFEFNTPSAMPAWVHTDPTRVRQILFNLLSNAIKFTEKGHVALHVECTTDATQIAHWVFSVQDTGIGMDADTQAQLFQRFHQVDSTATRKFGGTGLGLEISRNLARLMGGDISVQSTSGHGSTFTLTLNTPICDAPEDFMPTRPDYPAMLPPLPSAPVSAPSTPVTTAPTSAPAVSTPVAPTPAGGLNLLVAEDHPVNRKFIGTLLQKLGHAVTFAENGREAVERVQQQRFDLVFMDIHMPEMDGLTATRLIRGLPDTLTAHIPIVALTADVMNEARERAMAAGVNEFLSKPVQKSQLQEVIQHWCQPAA